jgi:hypothetical protein
MSIVFEPDRAILRGAAAAEDAESLLEWILSHPEGGVDLRGADRLHTAVVQVLLAARPPIVRDPEEAFLRTWLLPVLLGESRQVGE